MLFLLKIDQKNKTNQNNFSKVEKLRDFLNKVRLVAKNFIYVKQWSSKKTEVNSYINTSSVVFPNSRFLDIDLGRFNLKIINDTDPLIIKVKELRQKSFFENSKKKNLILMSMINFVIIWWSLINPWQTILLLVLIDFY